MFMYPRVGNVLTYPEAGSLHVAYFGHYVHSASTGLRCTLTNQLKTCREETNRASFIVLLSFSAKVSLPSLSAHTHLPLPSRAYAPYTLPGITRYRCGQGQKWTLDPETNRGALEGFITAWVLML